MARIATWIRENVRVVSGDNQGKPFRIIKWENDLLNRLETDSKDIALTIARGNGKTACISALCFSAIHPDGPLHRNNTEIDVIASSLKQGRIVFDDVLMMLRQAFGDNFQDDRKTWKMADSINHAGLTYKPHNIKFTCLASDPRRAHGLRPYLLICDEPAQWTPSSSDKMYSALRTGLGKVPGSRLIAIGTRPSTDNHWFSRMLDKPNAIVYQADKDDHIFDPKTWRKANPSWRYLPSLRERIREEAQDAKRDKTLVPAFRALRLNMGVSDTEEPSGLGSRHLEVHTRERA